MTSRINNFIHSLITIQTLIDHHFSPSYHRSFSSLFSSLQYVHPGPNRHLCYIFLRPRRTSDASADRARTSLHLQRSCDAAVSYYTAQCGVLDGVGVGAAAGVVGGAAAYTAGGGLDAGDLWVWLDALKKERDGIGR